jgi:aryl-alcohol dehydrogenase-like predicted oxidoreductase
VIVTDKSYALTLEEGRKAIEKSLQELGTDYIDIMMLHYIPFKSHWVKQKIRGKIVEYESGNLQKRMGALKAFCEAKESGVIKAVGLSTHSTQVLKQVLEIPEIDVVLTVLNKKGSWIEDGSLEAHLDALESIHKTGKGVYVCKIVDAGKLRDEGDSAIRFVLQYHSFIDAFNIGMYDKKEIENNIRIFNEVLGKHAHS